MSRNPKRGRKKADPSVVAQALAAAGSLYASGNLQGALDGCLGLIKDQGDLPEALQMAGIAAFQLGDASQAAKWMGRYCRLVPGDGESQYNLGVILQAAGQFEGASRAYLAALKVDPAKPEIYNNLGSVYETLSRFDDAEAAFRKGMTVAPDRLESPNNLGLLLHRLGRLADAEALFRKCLERAPNEPNVLNNLGLVLKDRGRIAEAVDIFEQVLRLVPQNPMALNNLGLALQSEDRLDEAHQAFSRVLAFHPGDIETHLNLADLNFGLGDKESAEKELRTILKADPANAKAYNLLMRVKKVTEPDDPDLRQVRHLLENKNLEAEQRQNLHLALADAYAALGDEKESFKHLKQGNDLKARRLPFDLKAERKRFQAIQSVFDQNFIDTRKGGGEASHRPIFILGMPRSGTTLVEQILDSHSDVYGAGELKSLGYQIEQVAPFFPVEVDRWSAETMAQIGQRYIADIATKGRDTSHVADKMPMNFLYIGVIRLALPNAKIIHCTRNALDTCYSCYRQSFSSGQLFSNDLKNLGAYYRLYEDLMGHWHDVLPGDILDFSYEKLVETPEPMIRQLLDYCGLGWQDRCLNFHTNPRQVRTASALQVRNPIYKGSVNAWKRVEHELAPLVKALEGE